MKTKEEQIADALWYLKANRSDEDRQKAIEILSDVIGDTRPEILLRPNLAGLEGKEIAIIIGHIPGGGTTGEREYNKIVAKHMAKHLLRAGAKVMVYEHSIKAYTARQEAMRKAVKEQQPNNFVCIELHYDAYELPKANGHHFQYRGAEMLAAFTRDEFQRRYPHSRPRENNGIKNNRRGNGAGFLELAPGWAMLTEPFFITNPEERRFFADEHEGIALVNCVGIAKFATYKSKQ